jgi:hypothetical protein
MPTPSSLPTAGSLVDPNLPIETLRGFLAEVVGLFDNITGPWAPLLFKDGDRRLLADAWAEYKDRTLPDVESRLRAIETDPQRLSDEDHRRIAEHGLTPGSTQLRLKFHGLSNAWQAFYDFGTVRLLRRLLDWINRILGSIASIIPGGDGLEEIKEAIKHLIQDYSALPTTSPKRRSEKNAENLLILHDPALAAKYALNWEAHRQHSQPYVGRGVR